MECTVSSDAAVIAARPTPPRSKRPQSSQALKRIDRGSPARHAVAFHQKTPHIHPQIEKRKLLQFHGSAMVAEKKHFR